MRGFLSVLNHWVDANLCFWENVLFIWLILCVPDKIIVGEVFYILEGNTFILGQKALATLNFWFISVITCIMKFHLHTEIFCFSFSFIGRNWIFLWPNTIIIFRFLVWSSCQFPIVNNKANDDKYSKVSRFFTCKMEKM